VQHEVSAIKEGPLGALHFELEMLGVKKHTGVFLHFAVHADVALLHQACAYAACPETLAEENVFKAHGFHGKTPR
jgi:hypothetical protein